MAVQELKSVEQFNTLIASKPLVAIDVWAQWCGPCRFISPVFEKHSESDEFKDKIVFAKVDADEVPDLSQELGVRAMPSFFFFKDGAKVSDLDLVGADPGRLEKGLKTLIE
jgi:thioredoxin 1